MFSLTSPPGPQIPYLRHKWNNARLAVLLTSLPCFSMSTSLPWQCDLLLTRCFQSGIHWAWRAEQNANSNFTCQEVTPAWQLTLLTHWQVFHLESHCYGPSVTRGQSCSCTWAAPCVCFAFQKHAASVWWLLSLVLILAWHPRSNWGVQCVVGKQPPLFVNNTCTEGVKVMKHAWRKSL